MYKCRDCGQTYQKSVEYCDCGNNTFDVIDEVVSVAKSKPSKKIIPVEDKISYGIFFLCLVLSFVIVFFVGNPKKAEKNSKTTVTLVKNKNIPSLNSIWDDTPIKVEEPKEVQEPVIEQKTSSRVIEDPPFIKQIFKQETKSKPKSQTPVKKPVENKVKDVSVKLPINTKDSQLAKIKTEGVNKGVNKGVNNGETVTKPQAKSEAKPQPKPQVTDYNNPEFISYKKALMQKLFSRFVVGGVSGSGSCIVSFSISDSGKLINRKFEQQSDNKTLNDAVYYMMMSVPTFNPPPAAYKGDTLRLKFLFDNGFYEFSYL